MDGQTDVKGHNNICPIFQKNSVQCYRELILTKFGQQDKEVERGEKE